MKGSTIVPEVTIENFDFTLDSSNFNVEIGSGFEAEVSSTLIGFFKSEIVSAIQTQALAQVHSQISGKINSEILDNYETSIEIADGISFSAGFTSKILVTTNYVQIPLDASVFLTKNGYQRTSTAALLPSKNPSVSEDVLCFVGEYFLTTLINAMDTEDFTYKTRVLGFPVTVNIT